LPTFEYKARTPTGELRSGIIESSSEDAALELLHQNNLMVISLKKGGEGLFDKFNFSSIYSGVRQKDLVVFSRQLAVLFEAKIPVAHSLKTLAAETSRPALRRELSEILNDVTGGLMLSQALAKYPRIFSPFYVHMIRSGEESGKLEEVLTYLADYLERTYYLTTKAKNAMIYPAFIILAFIGVLSLMLVVVIPKLLSIFEETNIALPLYTQIILTLSTFLRQWGIMILVLIALAATILWRWNYTAEGKLFIHNFQLKIPVLGDIYQKFYMARLSDNLKTLITGGIPLLQALTIAGDVIGNAVYEKAIRLAMESVKSGGTISSAFERVPEIPVLFTQMIKIGEASGKLDFILGNIARFYQREVDSAVDNLVTLIEPILIIFLGVGVGLLVAAVMIPLYTLVGQL
jgi:type IV pilus assembly protein PilC